MATAQEVMMRLGPRQRLAGPTGPTGPAGPTGATMHYMTFSLERSADDPDEETQIISVVSDIDGLPFNAQSAQLWFMQNVEFGFEFCSATLATGARSTGASRVMSTGSPVDEQVHEELNGLTAFGLLGLVLTPANGGFHGWGVRTVFQGNPQQYHLFWCKSQLGLDARGVLFIFGRRP